MASRRDFLKGLFAASIASQMPDIAPAQAEKLADAARRAIKIDLDEIADAGIEKMKNGWFRVWAIGRSVSARISLGDHAVTYNGLTLDGAFEKRVFSTFVKFEDGKDFTIIGGLQVIPSP